MPGSPSPASSVAEPSSPVTTAPDVSPSKATKPSKSGKAGTTDKSHKKKKDNFVIDTHAYTLNAAARRRSVLVSLGLLHKPELRVSGNASDALHRKTEKEFKKIVGNSVRFTANDGRKQLAPRDLNNGLGVHGEYGSSGLRDRVNELIKEDPETAKIVKTSVHTLYAEEL
jgi:histone H3/H4